MKTRRGSNYWSGQLGEQIHQFHTDDIVVSTLINDATFTGVVKEVSPKLNKVLVAWGGGAISQHDPDEIMLHPYASDFIRKRLDELKTASRRSRFLVSGSKFDILKEGDVVMNGRNKDKIIGVYPYFYVSQKGEEEILLDPGKEGRDYKFKRKSGKNGYAKVGDEVVLNYSIYNRTGDKVYNEGDVLEVVGKYVKYVVESLDRKRKRQTLTDDSGYLSRNLIK